MRIMRQDAWAEGEWEDEWEEEEWQEEEWEEEWAPRPGRLKFPLPLLVLTSFSWAFGLEDAPETSRNGPRMSTK